MDDDKTIIRSKIDSALFDDDKTILRQPITLDVQLVHANGEILASYSFSSRFTVGRAADNSVVINSDVVSRYHLEIKPEYGEWWVYNLKSTNGVYLNGQLVQHKEKLNFPAVIGLGLSGFCLNVQDKSYAKPKVEAPSLASSSASMPNESKPSHIKSAPSRSQAEIEDRLLAGEDEEDMSDYTLLVRRVIHQDRIKHVKSYKKVIWILGALFVVAASLGTYQHIALANTRELAIGMFYDIKTLEVSLSQADIRLEENALVLENTIQAISKEHLRIAQDQLILQREKLSQEKQRMRQERERLATMKAKYRQYVEEANALRLRFPTAAEYEEELIAKVARELGESELELPEDFVSEVRKYIQLWQSSSRMPNAIANIEKNNYLPHVISTLKQQGLPLYFVYLPLQESNYDPQAIGPETNYGIAKGAWQLLSTTAQQYGLKTGPLADAREYDEQDQRFDFNQATQAGIKYIKQIYSTEAQASGLLVMASYNYGDNRVKRMISRMPDNPRDKNFWKFLQQYELPKETRDYVFYIFSAAVIGEDPQHFGFKFNPPLLSVPEKGNG